MENIPPAENLHLSPARKMLADYVLRYALIEGGSTPDVVRHAAFQMASGTILLAEVLDPDRLYPDEERIEGKLLSLSVCTTAGEDIETLAIQPETGYVASSMGDALLFLDTPQGAPDFTIESFFVRHIVPASTDPQ